MALSLGLAELNVVNFCQNLLDPLFERLIMRKREAPARALGPFITSENPRAVTGVSAQRQLSVLSTSKAAPKTWVNSTKIQFLLKSLVTCISALTVPDEVHNDLVKQLKMMSGLVAPDMAKQLSLPRLFDEFWRSWRRFRSALNSVLESDEAPSILAFCVERLKTVQAMIQRGEGKVPEGRFSPERFEYVYGKFETILPMFENADSLDINAILHHLRSVQNILTKRTASFFVSEGDFQFCLRNLKHVMDSLQSISRNDAAKEAVVTEFGSTQAALRKLVSVDLKEQKKEPRMVHANSEKKEEGKKKKRQMPKYDMPEFDTRPTVISRPVYPKKRSMTPPAARVRGVALRQAELRTRKLAPGERVAAMKEAFIPLSRKQGRADTASCTSDKKRRGKLSPSKSAPHLGKTSKAKSSAFDPRMTSRRYRNEDARSRSTVAPAVTNSNLSPHCAPGRKTSPISSGSYNDMSDSPYSRKTGSHVDQSGVGQDICVRADDKDSVTTCDFGTNPKGYHEQPEEELYEYYTD